MRICIAGMHRSGTSMISAIFRNAGVYLGEEADFLPAKKENPEGFWEHFGFYALNEGILKHLGAGWDMPDLPAGWESRGDLAPFRADAQQLIARMDASANGSPAWGWKDPRNCLTIAFWKALIPGMRVVVCVRNPLDVAASLASRNNFSTAASGRLWLKHYQCLLDHVPEQDRVVTIYENYFSDPAAEWKRVFAQLGLPVDESKIEAIRGTVKPALQHHHATNDELLASDLGPEVTGLYARLLAEAASPGKKSASPGTAAPAPVFTDAPADNLQSSRFLVETAQREEHIRHLVHENTALRGSLDEMKGRLDETKARLDDTKARIDALEKEQANHRAEQLENARRFSVMAERAVSVHGLIAHKRAQFAHLQARVQSTLKDNKPFIPRVLRFSNTVNSVYRIFKRLSKMGRFLVIQRELNDAVSESLGTLTHLSTVLAGHRPNDAEAIPPGLELYAYEKTNVDVPELMQALRIRLS